MLDSPDTRPPSLGQLTRRRFLVGGLAAGAALAAAEFVSTTGIATAEGDATAAEGAPTDLQKFDSPGTALMAAQRMDLLPDDDEIMLPVPDDDEILFPVVVGPEDSCYVLDNYGDCRGTSCGRSHEGVDIMADEGLSVVSVSAGVIEKRYDDRGVTYGAGNGWTIHDEDGDVVYRYFHLQTLAEGLDVGDRVERGDVIGTVGETGTSGAGNERDNFHLHFEYRPNDDARDSFDLLQRPTHVRFEGD